MTKIYLVRHAECVGNIEKRLTGYHDYELTKEGIEQAQELKESLKSIKFNNIYASPLKRAIGTVEPIARFQKKNIQTYKELGEMNFGKYDGYTWKEVDKLDKTILHNSKKEIEGIPNQETTKHVQERMIKVVRKLADENNGKTILICSHGISIEAFLRGVKRIPFNVESQKYSQSNTEVNEIEYENGKFKIVKMEK